MYANPARQTNSVHTFLAKDARQIAAQQLDPTEEMVCHAATRAEVEHMIDTHEFSQSLHIASFYRALAMLARST